MALKAGTAYVPVEPDLTNFQKQVGSKMSGIGRGLMSAGKGLSLAVTLPLIAFGKTALDQFEQAEQVAGQTAAVIKSTGGAAGVSAKQVGDLADQISKYSAIDDEVIAQGENMLLTFRNIRNEAGKGNDIFNQATTSLVDFAAAMGQDPKTAAIKLGKALNDPIKGMTALGKAGVQFTEQQKHQITVMVESGDVLGAQKIILKELQAEFGGSAAANATASMRMKVAFDNLAESLGEVLAPAIQRTAEWLGRLTSHVEALTPETRRIVVALAAFAAATGPALLVIGKLVTVLPKASLGFTKLTTAMGGAIPGLALFAYGAEQGYLQLRQYLDGDIFGGIHRGLQVFADALHVTIPALDESTISIEDFEAQTGTLKEALGKGKISVAEFRARMTALGKAAGGTDDSVARLIETIVREAGAQTRAAAATKRDTLAHHKAAAAARDQKAAEASLTGGLVGFIQAQRDHAAALKNLTDLRKKGKQGTEEFRAAELDVITTEGDLRTTRKEYIDELKRSGLTQDQAKRKFKEFGLAAGLAAGDIRRLNRELGTLNTLTGNINLPAIPSSVAHHLPHLAEGGIVSRPTIAMIGEHGPEAVTPLHGAGRQMHVIVDNPHDFTNDNENVRLDRRMARSER